MSATMTETNGTHKVQRKQLADQIDRLESVLDGLADGLNGAVADAARDGTRAAVKEILVEVLSDPEVLAMLQAKAAPQTSPVSNVPAAPSVFSRVRQAVGMAAVAVGREVKTVAQKVASLAKNAVLKVKGVVAELKDAATFAARTITESSKGRRIALVSIAIGAVVAVLSQVNHTVASVLSGAGAVCTAAAVQGGLWLRGAAKRFGLM